MQKLAHRWIVAKSYIRRQSRPSSAKIWRTKSLSWLANASGASVQRMVRCTRAVDVGGLQSGIHRTMGIPIVGGDKAQVGFRPL